MPTHYGFKVSSSLGSIRKRYEKLLEKPKSKLDEKGDKGTGTPAATMEDINSILDGMNEDGAWLEKGKLKYIKGARTDGNIISSETFIRNLTMLSNFLSE